MNKITLDQEIFLIEDFLSIQECDAFIEKGEQVNFEEAKVNVDGRQVKIKGIRNNERVLFKDEFLANSLFEKMKSFVPKTMELYEVSGLNELFRIYKYSKGQRFKMHRDGSYQRNEQECSFFSFLIYLNEDFEGGETYFEKGINVKPKTGSVLVFKHPLRHEGKSLISGIKYVLRTDIMYKLK